jgi:hypothetical protein
MVMASVFDSPVAVSRVVDYSSSSVAPGERHDTHNRVRIDRVGQAGSVTLRVNGRLHHIGIGRIHYRTRVLILSQDLNIKIKIINAVAGEILRDFTLDPTRDYQSTGAPKGPTRKRPRTKRRFRATPMSCDITWCPRHDSNMRHRL